MYPVIEKLLALQDRDQRIQALKTEQDAIPRERAARAAAVAALEAKLEQSRQRAKEIEVERKTLEVEVQSKQETIARYKGQQMQTRKNEEYSALSHEIAAAEKIISALEDRELELMEEAESLRPQINAAEEEFTRGRDQVNQQLAGLETKAQNIQTRLTELESGRQALCEGIEEDEYERYERLFRSKGGSAVVALEGDICTGCHMKVPAQTVVEARSGKSIVQCPQCGRIVFFPG